MIAFGKFNTLTVSNIQGHEVIFDGGENGEIRLADKNLAESCRIGQQHPVFVFIDGNQQIQASLITPKAQVDEVAWLKVVSLSHAGAFLDWGLPKDLLVPFSEQKTKMVEGRYYLVRLFLDESNRIAASMLLEDFIQEQVYYLKEGQAVDLIIADETELGVKAIINHQYWGLLYKNEIFQPLEKGQKIPGFIKHVRPDNKVDLILTQDKYTQQVNSAATKILSALQKQAGYIALTDKSPPEQIYQNFGISKKIFKQAIGGLYKERKILIEANGIRLVEK